ncbi:hypothetical protein F2Q70_00031133 [Brassica cretica]|uniref:Uncharacterized protein n=1 Tax=Brassica cretica TaxID=69181 RepID=A0A8S9FMG9_BRACR|nr:hypothetical protein F2Q70_00031133 [Brassica cretica]
MPRAGHLPPGREHITYNAKVLPEELTRLLSGMEYITYNAKVLPEELTLLLSGSLFDLRVLNTTSGSERTSGFSNDLRVLIRPQGPKYDLRDLKENLRVPTRPSGPDTISGSKGETPDSHITSGSKSDLRVQNDLRVHKTPPGYKRPPGQKRRSMDLT